jgi:hypothetical protein
LARYFKLASMRAIESTQAPILAILCVSRLHAHQWLVVHLGRHSRPLHGCACRTRRNRGMSASGCNSPLCANSTSQYLDLLGRMGFNIMRQGAIHHLLDMYRTTANYSKI